MFSLVDTLFEPIINWLISIRQVLLNASVPLSQELPIQSLFSPIAMISPQWALLISNVFVMAFVYIIIYIASNGVGLVERFRNSVKWW